MALPLAPILAWSLVGALIQVVETLVGRVLLSLGIGYVTYTGVDMTFAWAKTQFLNGVSGLPPEGIQIMAMLKIGVCVSMLLSALTARLVLMGLTSGTVKKMVIK